MFILGDEMIFIIRKDLRGNKTCVAGLYIIPCLEYGGVTTTWMFKTYLSVLKLTGPHDRFWQTYRENTGKWVKMQLGINSVRKFPLEIAQYLELPAPETFTSHSLRRTFATNLADAGRYFSEIWWCVGSGGGVCICLCLGCVCGVFVCRVVFTKICFRVISATH